MFVFLYIVKSYTGTFPIPAVQTVGALLRKVWQKYLYTKTAEGTTVSGRERVQYIDRMLLFCESY